MCLCVTKLLKRKWQIFSRFKAPKFVQSKVFGNVCSCCVGLSLVRLISENFRVTLRPFGSTSSVYISRVVEVQFPTAVLSVDALQDERLSYVHFAIVRFSKQ